VLLAWVAAHAGGSTARATLSGAVLGALIVFYDAYHKQNPLSPILMALNRVLVYVTSALALSASLNSQLGWGCFVLFCYLVGLTYAAKQENLSEPRGMWPLLLMQLPLLGYALAHPGLLTLISFALLSAWVAICLVFLLHPRRRNIKRAVGYLIAGICLLDAMLAASQSLPLLTALCVVGFAATLLSQRYVPGT
jgi:hypothetical protein